MFPVEVCYLKEPCSDYAEAAVQTVFDIHLRVSNRPCHLQGYLC